MIGIKGAIGAMSLDEEERCDCCWCEEYGVLCFWCVKIMWAILTCALHHLLLRILLELDLLDLLDEEVEGTGGIIKDDELEPNGKEGCGETNGGNKCECGWELGWWGGSGNGSWGGGNNISLVERSRWLKAAWDGCRNDELLIFWLLGVLLWFSISLFFDDDDPRCDK